MDGLLPTGRATARFALMATALAATCMAGCSGFQGTTAASFLRKVRDDPDPNVRYLAYQHLSSPNCYDDEAQKAEAVRTLIGKLGQGLEPVASRAMICRTLGELRDPAAHDALIQAVGDPEGVVRAQACRALGKVGRSEDATVRIAAIEGIGELKVSDPRVLEVLVTDMDHDDPAIRWASLQALRKITGKDLGAETAPWRKYLQNHLASAGTSAARH
jgi:HEAT repeat protein